MIGFAPLRSRRALDASCLDAVHEAGHLEPLGDRRDRPQDGYVRAKVAALLAAIGVVAGAELSPGE